MGGVEDWPGEVGESFELGFLGPKAWLQEWSSPTGCHPAGGIRTLSPITQSWSPKSADWAQVPSRDSFPYPSIPTSSSRLPPPQANGGCEKLQYPQLQGRTLLGASPLPINLKVSYTVLVPSQALPHPFSKENPCLFV